MTDIDLTDQMKELLNKDRLLYLDIIMQSDGALRSLDIAHSISEMRAIKGKKEIKNENIKVNKRLKKMVSLGILIQLEEGKYSVSSLGYLLADSWKELTEKATTMNKFHDFFKDHYIIGIPREFFGSMYKLREAELTQNTVIWKENLVKKVKKTNKKLYNLTQYLHDYPEQIIEKKKNGEIDIVIVYQFDKYPELNYSGEKELFDRLVDAGVEFRYIELKNRYPIGIRIVDDKWSTFLLSRTTNGKLDRDQVFIGEDKEFVKWCRDLMYHIWSFEAESLDVNKVVAKEKE